MHALHGRIDSIARAQARMERACAGEGALLLLTGEAGIGKSKLAEHLSAIAAAAGCTVVWGRCWEAGGAPAYWPWIQIFRDLQMQEDPFADAGKELGGSPEEVRFRAFDRAVLRLKERANQSPLALFIDDLHAADVPSLLLLLLLARQLRRAPLVVVGAYRDVRTDLRAGTGAVLDKIAREGEVLALTRLSPEHVGAWTREVFPGASEEQIGAVFQLTEGHPLFVNEVLRAGFPRVHRDGLLEGLGSLLDERLAGLPDATRAALEVAAVLGREFSADEVAAISGMPVDEVDQCLRAARDARVIGAIQARAGRLIFSHLLLRDRTYAEISPSRRAALHWAAGSVRLARGEDAATAAHHLIEGSSAGSALQAGRVTLRAATGALDRFAFEDAVQLCHRGLDLSALRAEEPRLECELRLVLAQALLRVGRPADGKRVCNQASSLARQIGAADLFARAALVYGSALFASFRDAELVGMLREALAGLDAGASALRAKLMARLAAALNPPRASDVPEILRLAREATLLARGLGDEDTLLEVLQSAASSVVFLAGDEERLAILEEVVRLGRALDQRVAVLEYSGWYIGALIGSCQPSRAASELTAYQRLLAEFPGAHFRWRLPLALALQHALRGEFADADRHNAEAHELALRGGSGPGLRAWGIQCLSIAQLRGQPESVAAHATELLALFEPLQPYVPTQAWMLAALSQPDAALRRLRSYEIDPGYTPGLVFGAETCVMLGERELGAAYYPPLCALAPSHRMFWGPAGGAAFGPMSRTLGELALLLGREQEAAQHFADALELCERMGSAALVALCRHGHERALQRRSAASPPALAAPPGSAPRRLRLRREGDIWTIESGIGRSFRLKHSKGLMYLQLLIDQSGQQLHVLELAGVEHATGDAGPVLDARAKAEYKRRLDELNEELREADGFGDMGRRERAQRELDAVAEQLARALGLGGKDRRASSDIERARINVQRRLKDVLERIGAHDAALARYLANTLSTGIYCSFDPGNGDALQQ